jgi:bla regulator protein BlaR1
MNSLEWFQFMLSFGLQASFVTFVACALERRCHNASVKTRIWTCYYVGLLGALASGLLLPRIRWAGPWRRLPVGELLKVIHVEQAIGGLMLNLWLTGSCFMLLRWVVSSLRLRQFLRRCCLVDVAEYTNLQNFMSRELLRPQGRAVEFRVGPESFGPFCYQLHRPVVFLPPSILRGNIDELRHVLLHELAHLRTQHPLQVFAQRLVQTFLWFLPLVWTAGRRASLAREFVCDDAATGQGASTASYLRTLLRFAQQQRASFDAVLAIARSASELKIRARRLASSLPSTNSGPVSLAPMTMVLSAILATQIWLPTNPLASATTFYSPWPAWSAAALHAFDVSVRDFDQYDARLQVYDLNEDRKVSQAVQN